MSSEKTAGATIGAAASSWPLASILTIVFVVLKLTDNIDWSWLWVVSPLWISAAFGFFMLFVFVVTFILAFLFSENK